MQNEILKQVADRTRREHTLATGNTVSIKLLKTTAGIAVAKKLLNVIAPAVGGAADGMRHDALVHGAPTSFTDMALTLCDQIDKLQIENVIAVLLDEVYINGDPINFEEYFQANYGELIEILEFALKENFQTFFTGKGIKARFLTAIQGLILNEPPAE